MDACEECFSLAFFPKRFSTWSPSHPTKSRHTKPRPARPSGFTPRLSSQEPGTPGQNIFAVPVIATATVFQVHLVFEKYWIMIWDYLTIWDAGKTIRHLRVSIMWDCGETGVYPESIQIHNLITRFPRHKKRATHLDTKPFDADPTVNHATVPNNRLKSRIVHPRISSPD